MTCRSGARLALLALAVSIVACSGSKDGSSSTPTSPSPAPTPPPPSSPAPPSPSPTPSGCAPSVTGLPSSIPGQGGKYQFSIAVSSTCAWTARTDVGWADVAPGSGNGNSTPTLNVNENSTFFTRSFTVTVNGQTFPVTQATASCSYTVDPTSLEESSQGGQARLTVSTGPGCGWTVTASEGWIRVLTTSGTGSATIFLDLAQNTGDVRNAFLTVAGQQVPVRQRRSGS